MRTHSQFALGPLKDLTLDLLHKDPRRRPSNEDIKARLELASKGVSTSLLPGPLLALGKSLNSSTSQLHREGSASGGLEVPPAPAAGPGINGYRGALMQLGPPSITTTIPQPGDRYRGMLESVPAQVIRRESSVVEAEAFNPHLILIEPCDSEDRGGEEVGGGRGGEEAGAGGEGGQQQQEEDRVD